MKRVLVLGATGSIGASTADVLLRHPDKFSAWGLVGHRNVARMAELVAQLRPEKVAMTDPEAARALAEQIGREVLAGPEAAEALAAAKEADIVVAAMVGAAGVPSALAAVRAGKHLALANKESLVTAGRIFVQTARATGARIVPVDSEHAAAHQLMRTIRRKELRRLVLTASGGPFLRTPLERLAEVTPEEAVAHPNWSMGAKISVDSATMMNKALELIEARWL
ncbi:MAG: 1-deoxy-D-xylulose-5-phosphate reductoisomerase, partial [Zetaproteobacteria bacterium]